MGETSRQLQRDINTLRQDADAVLHEMDQRMEEMMDVRKQVKRHPYAAVGTGVALLGGVGLLTYGLWTRSHGPGGGLWPVVRGPATEDLTEGRIERQNHHAEMPRSEGVVKRVLWAVMVSAGLTLGSYMTRKLMESAWTKTMGEAPPAR